MPDTGWAFIIGLLGGLFCCIMVYSVLPFISGWRKAEYHVTWSNSHVISYLNRTVRWQDNKGGKFLTDSQKYQRILRRVLDDVLPEAPELRAEILGSVSWNATANGLIPWPTEALVKPENRG